MARRPQLRLAALGGDGTPARQVARLVAQASDEQLATLVAASWPAVIEEAFRRFPDYLDASRTRGVEAVIEWRIAGPGRAAPQRYSLFIAAGSCRAERDSRAQPRVALALGAVDFLRVVTGNASPAALFLTGRLEVSGDARLALALATFFRPPTANGEVADPAAVDPVEIARVLKAVPDRELRARLRDGLRHEVLDEIFRRFPDYLDPAATRQLETVIKFTITGRADGGADRYLVTIDHGACRTSREGDRAPRVTIRMEAGDFLKLVTGNASPTMSFLRGRLKVKGDLAFAAQLPRLFRIPSAGA